MPASSKSFAVTKTKLPKRIMMLMLGGLIPLSMTAYFYSDPTRLRLAVKDVDLLQGVLDEDLPDGSGNANIINAAETNERHLSKPRLVIPNNSTLNVVHPQSSAREAVVVFPSKSNNMDTSVSGDKPKKSKFSVKLKLPEPVIVLGYPKSGTTSVWNYFNCSGVVAQHLCAKGEVKDHYPCEIEYMNKCILKNLAKNRPIFEGCGEYQVYAQIDGERPRSRRGVLMDDGTFDKRYTLRHFLPQHFHLDKIHEYAPNATYVLPLRPPSAWVNSVMNWFRMKAYVISEYRAQNETIEKPADPKAFLERIYIEHSEFVRNFVKQHPSHTLIEVDITDKNAGKIMEDAFGPNAKCWGHKNAKETHSRLVGNKATSNKIPKEADVKVIPLQPSEDDKKSQPSENDDKSTDALQNSTSNKSKFKVQLKLPEPVIVVGYPKSGTTSVWNFFTCSGVVSQHFCSKGETRDTPPCKMMMARCILDNLAQNKSILEGCGDYQVYAQLDGERPRGRNRQTALLENGESDPQFQMRHFLPQHFHLDKIHEYAPNATFILPLRPAASWRASVMNWFKMRIFVLGEYRGHNRTMEKPTDRKKWLEQIYNEHSEFVRDFVRRHPSHTLIEVNITDDDAGRHMAESFGLDESCWGHKNAKEIHDKLRSFKKPKATAS